MYQSAKGGEVTGSSAANCDQRDAARRFALEMVQELRDPLDTLANLNYLILHAADDPEQIRHYARLGEEQIVTLARIVRRVSAS